MLLTVVSTQTGFNIGDVIFQMMMLLTLVGIPILIIFLIRSRKNQKDQLKRVEEKVDQLLADKENKVQ
ncbi:hypothetical protein M3182_08915 [Mesobacillus maritimus]|uniref:hypothetical protein n=1 Tax=Mesobacillus maritimus TaxID=1643336 RepID=UPI00203DE83D|nr:hypothetical protein [Mesobacillus maritimus]MCM3585863.1 hypothetical protein [Mesobacillus maritimus]